VSERPAVDVAVIGSGFAGAITARVLRRRGLRVALLERDRHPRFALGESSTPLAAISLEILAERYRLPDLRALAAYGRWMAAVPHLRRGLKRGFTFFAHEAGKTFTEGGVDRRLLVAASPDVAIADSHWLRSDVDAFLVERAVAEGVLYRDRVELDTCEETAEGMYLAGASPGGRLHLEAGFVVDASGGGGFLARCLPMAPVEPPAVDTALVYGHFSGVPDFAAVVAAEGKALPPGPYPDDRAAVHHLLGVDGWMYVLPFDHGVVSAGFVLRREGPAARELLPDASGNIPPPDPEALFLRLAALYPTIAAQFATARPQRPVGLVPRLACRRGRATGGRWLLLPSTFAFTDPLFSTGIAWSLAGVERVGELFAGTAVPEAEDLDRYGALLKTEADHIDALLRGAFRAMGDFRLFAPFALVYFAAASFQEALRRLRPEARPWPWEGFLGAADRELGEILSGVLARLEELTAGGREPSGEECRHFAAQVGAAIAPRNIAGLADPARGNLYPVDFEPLVAGAARLGLTPEEVRAALPRLRG